ncbi:translation initiation factor eIF-1A [archaeon]|jgi:translation initiation factor 1A|nr:translation initiation factor eIF-1A [archaeon]MBT4397638.1 translation initiation factor eIF-1A [archaeon]MBT4441666.1 translation initiation factor eIF-1A [archaeon]
MVQKNFPKKKPKPKFKGKGPQPAPTLMRVRLPRGNESLGVVEARLGQGRLRVSCYDGKARVCRIPGRLKRRLWVREGDFILVQPWQFGGDEKGDVIYKYRPAQVQWLKKRGHIKEITVDLEDF